jgi:hypothetical protein
VSGVQLSARRILGPVLFNKIINFERYLQANLEPFFSELAEEERLHGLFQQDSATAHTLYISTRALSDVFGDRIIGSDIWPLRSPDLNSFHFFFWGCLKDKVYNSNPRREKLKKKYILMEIANIPAEQIQKLNQNLYHWCEEYLRVEGQHSTPPLICEL